MDESDIYYVDTRNADNRDRVTVHAGGSSGFRPGVSGPIRAVVAQPARVYAPPYAQPPFYGNPYGSQPLGSSLFGRITGGQLVDLVAQIFAAVMPLPPAPTATADAATDVGNLILYQGSLASYAKRDEQIRTLGNLVTKLLG